MKTYTSLYAAILAGIMLLAQPAFAQSAEYSTDMDEVDIATLKNDICCNAIALKQDANVRLRVQHALYAVVPLNVEVLDENQQQVAKFTTRDKVIYMRLPEGHYTIKVNAFVKNKSISVEADDEVLKSYAI